MRGKQAISEEQARSEVLVALCRHRTWSARVLITVVVVGLMWSAVTMQRNLAPPGPSDPLYWFSYLIEAMVAACLVIVMVSRDQTAPWGVEESRLKIAAAELALLMLTVALTVYPAVAQHLWSMAALQAIAPVMTAMAVVIHDAASSRYGAAIARAMELSSWRHATPPAEPTPSAPRSARGSALSTGSWEPMTNATRTLRTSSGAVLPRRDPDGPTVVPDPLPGHDPFPSGTYVIRTKVDAERALASLRKLPVTVTPDDPIDRVDLFTVFGEPQKYKGSYEGHGFDD